MVDYYKLLDVDRGSSEEEIKKAYRRLMKAGAHPDLGGDGDRAKDLNAAYRTLLDPNRRARYDADLRDWESSSFSRAGYDLLKAFSRLRTHGFAPGPPPEPGVRLVRCPSCSRANRLPETRTIVGAHCGACQSPLTGALTSRLQALEHLKTGLRLKREGSLREALPQFHAAIRLAPTLQNPYLEIAAIYHAWGLPHQARIHEELGELEGRHWLSEDELGIV